MTREQAIEKLKALQGTGLIDTAHVEADRVLCNLLVALGYSDVVDEYDKIEKEYS